MFTTLHQQFTFVRLLDSHLTEYLVCLFRDANDPSSLLTPPTVVWCLSLQAGSEGPTLISHTVSWHKLLHIEVYAAPRLRYGTVGEVIGPARKSPVELCRHFLPWVHVPGSQDFPCVCIESLHRFL